MTKNNRKKRITFYGNTVNVRDLMPVPPAEKEVYDLAFCQKLAEQLKNREINQLIIYRDAKTKELEYVVDEGDFLTDFKCVVGYVARFNGRFQPTENMAERMLTRFEGETTDIPEVLFDMIKLIEENPPVLQATGGAFFSETDTISKGVIDRLSGHAFIEMYFESKDSDKVLLRVTELGKFMVDTYALPY